MPETFHAGPNLGQLSDVTIIHGDCIEAMRELADDSIDAIVTDPPYGLEFMGKEWDSFKTYGPGGKNMKAGDATIAARQDGEWQPGATYGYRQKQPRCRRCGKLIGRGTGVCKCPAPIVDTRTSEGANQFQYWCEDWAVEALRVLKPGGHLLAFGGTRTWHRLAVAVEDAGFEIRDSIAWLYGSGFPKSLDVSKAIDKAAGATGTYGEPKSAAHAEMLARGVARRGEKHPGWDRPWMDDPEAIDKAQRKYEPATPEAEQWQGWGTALKPAFEPVVVGRKPFKGNVAANVLQHGTGALNIDACRIGTEERIQVAAGSTSGRRIGPTGLTADTYEEGDGRQYRTGGRWPANVILDESQAAALDEQSAGTRAAKPSSSGSDQGGGIWGSGSARETQTYLDGGGASRFFMTAPIDDMDARFRYNAKAPKKERPTYVDADGKQQSHATVKPLTLMRWLVRLVTPPGGVVCKLCDNSKRDSTKTAGNAEVVRDVWKDVQGQGQPEEAQVLFEAVRGSGGTDHTSSATVRDVRGDVHARPNGEACSSVLLEAVRRPLDGGEPLNDEGLRHQRQGLQDAVPTGSSDGDEHGVYRGASSSSSRDAGSDADSGRSGPPSQRGQAGQPTGELGSPIQAGARQDSEAAAEAYRVSPLWRDDQSLGTCATCGSGLSREPGIILDPFAGSGTTVEAALQEGFRVIGIERETDYLPMIQQRIARCLNS